MATSFLAISSYMSAAPLNPNYKAEEFEFYLSDLKPKILIVDHNSKNPADAVARSYMLGVMIAKHLDEQHVQRAKRYVID